VTEVVTAPPGRSAPTPAGLLAAIKALGPRLAERAAAHDRAATFPHDDVADLKATGLTGLLTPTRLGGAGAGFRDYTRIAVALGRASGATALVFNMHASVTGALAGVPEELARQMGAPDAFFTWRDEVLAAAAGGALYGVAITEAGAGSRLSALQTTYAREGDGYRIRGRKSVSTGAGLVDAALVAARAADAVDGADPRISYFLVPTAPGTPGVTSSDTWDPLGMRATASNALTLDTVVPAAALLGGIEGVAVLMAYALPQWLVASYAAVYVGVARAVVDAAVAHLGDRVAQAGGGAVAGAEPRRGALTSLASVRARIGRADAQVEAARLVLDEAGRLVDLAPGDPETNRMVYRAKLLAGDVAQDVAASCTEACGLGALRRGSELERLYRDARCGAVMPPSSDLCADVLGTAAFGLDPFTAEVKPW